MYFEAQKNWEINSKTFSLFDGPEKRRFPLVELSLNSDIFIVDIIFEMEDDCGVTQRFMFGSVLDALNFIDQPKVVDSTISHLSRRCDNGGEYMISDLVEIIEAKDKADQNAYIFCCRNGRRYVDSILTDSENALSNKKIIYFKTQKP